MNGLADPNVQGSTPTGNAYATAQLRADMNDTSRARYTILVTDGDPSGCQPGGYATPEDYAFEKITEMRTSKSVRTYVLSFAGGSVANLVQMADAGGTIRPGCDGGAACYYSASNYSQLDQALDAIAGAVVGEFGGGCDDSCYGQGCPSGQICKNAACEANACASVTCPSGQSCVDGTCKAHCNVTCASNQRCENGQCVADVQCSPGCTAQNQVCVNGQCVEDYCSGSSYNLRQTCPSTHICYRNACQLRLGADAGPLADGGDGENPGGGCGCSSGAGAMSIVAAVAFVMALASRRRRS
jgi:MYXO-CTERM domain-containing protein